MGEAATAERRTRRAQREAVERVVREPEEPLLLRTVDGEVVVFEELPAGPRPATDVRARVLPDGNLLVPQHRFARS